MQCIYEVRYEVQWESSEPTHWEAQTVKVCCGPDAQEAVDRAKERLASADKAVDKERAKAALERAQNRLKLASKYKK